VKLVKGAWKILVGIKDFLVLIFMLLFFTMLFAALSAKPNAAAIRDGALVVALDGTLVEQPEEADPFGRRAGRRPHPVKQQRLRDVVRALDAAKDRRTGQGRGARSRPLHGRLSRGDHRSRRGGGRVRAGGKPVLAYATGLYR
jgi:protease-4